MLDIQFIKEFQEKVEERLRSRGEIYKQEIQNLLSKEIDRKKYETNLQSLQAERNQISKKIGQRESSENLEEKKLQVRKIAEKIERIKTKLEEILLEQREIHLCLPNLPYENCPKGRDFEGNQILRVLDKNTREDTPPNHVDILENLKIADFEKAGKIFGAGFSLLIGSGAKLQRALIQFLLNLQIQENGYREVYVPVLIPRECMIGTGQLPKFEEEMYGLEGKKYFLAPTAEVPLTNLYRDSILKMSEFPIQLIGQTSCFRKEAGSGGKLTRGLLRLHQFEKVELVWIEHPEHSFESLEILTSHAEKALQLLEIPYRVIELCTGDLGFSSAKTYDLEVWSPANKVYWEVSSCSNFTDYQARRLKLRFKDKTGETRLCHTLNGSGLALPRLIASLVENHWNKDGSISIPPALQPYFGGEKIS